MKIKLNILLLAVSLLLAADLSAQVSQPMRLEIDVDGLGFELASAGDKGLFLFRNINLPMQAGKQVMEVLQVDTSLSVNWRREYIIDTEYSKLGQFYINGELYLLFSSVLQGNKRMSIVSFDVKSGVVQNYGIKNFIPFTYFDFKIINNTVLIGGYYNYRPLVVLYNLENKIPKVLPGFFNERSTLIEMKVNDNNTFDIILNGNDIDKNGTLFINTFDESGTLLKKISLEAEKSKSLLFGRAETLSDQAQIVAGVYGKRHSEYSRGVFIANINEYGEQKIKFYNYAELQNFFHYMKARRERRIMSRIERKKIKDKRIRFNYRLLVHQLIRHQDQYILLGEAFYPKYRTITSGNNNLFTGGWVINRGIFSQQVVFDGYRYTHAVLLGFDERGNLLWDNSFEINDVTSFELEQFVHAYTSKDQIGLLYVYDNAIRSKIVSKNQVLEGKEQHEIALTNSSDELVEKSTKIGGLERWYGNVFFTYGTQQIRNFTASGVPITRNVFFLNKVVFE